MAHQSVLKAGDFRGRLLVCSCKWQRRETLGVQTKPNKESEQKHFATVTSSAVFIFVECHRSLGKSQT